MLGKFEYGGGPIFKVVLGLLVTRMKVICACFVGGNLISLSLMDHWRQFLDGSVRWMDHGTILF